MAEAKVALIMGSLSDKSVLEAAALCLDRFSVSYVWEVVSAHRTPEAMLGFALGAEARGLQVIIAAAGGAAHLPGMVASATHLPVIGVPVQAAASLQGWDSVLSILQMPAGVPVATMAINGAENAALLAIQILSLQDKGLTQKLKSYKKALQKKVATQNKTLQKSR